MAGFTRKLRWSNKEIQFLRDNYLSMSSKEISNKINRSYNSVQNRLKRLYKDCVKEKRTTKTQIRYSLDESKLLSDSEEFYYLMGLISSDGNISKKKNLITIKLHEKDSKLLYDIKDYFGITHPINDIVSNGFKIGSRARVLSFSSGLLKKRLASFGIYPAKSKTICIKKSIPNKFLGSFIRGVFDGDGSVCRTKDNSFIVVICSMSRQFIEYMQRQIGYGRVSTNAAGMSFLNIRSYERRDFYNLMYQNATIFLNRKYSLMKQSLEYGNAKEIA